jgi:hypothetical protein
MKKLLLVLAIALGLTKTTQAQVITTVDCNTLSLIVNVSDTDFVKLYHPGHYLTGPQNENIIVWEITDSQGIIIAQDTLINNSDFSFYHNIPLTDTINVTAHLWNDSAIHNGYPVNCLIEDQLHWEVFNSVLNLARWEFIHNNFGIDQNIILGIDDIVLDNKQLIKIVDILDKTTEFKPNTLLFYIYKDGTVEKKYILDN